jgi:hypothetical protein
VGGWWRDGWLWCAEMVIVEKTWSCGKDGKTGYDRVR